MGKVRKCKRYNGRKSNVEENCYFEDYLKSISKSIFKTFILKSSEKVSDLINIDNIPSFIH